ncbi:MAG: DNA-directed RNA polymerase subunit omega, partial [Gammaproteobacteria bacterium]
RYDLVMLASKRARDLSMGAEPLVDVDNDKPTVVALREIAEELITNENVDTIGKPVIVDDFAESGSIEFPMPE